MAERRLKLKIEALLNQIEATKKRVENDEFRNSKEMMQQVKRQLRIEKVENKRLRKELRLEKRMCSELKRENKTLSTTINNLEHILKWEE